MQLVVKTGALMDYVQEMSSKIELMSSFKWRFSKNLYLVASLYIEFSNR